METINDRIRILLDESGKTRTAFAESLKVSQQYISKLIRTGNPSDLLISDICEKYNINEHWLRTGEGKMDENRSTNEKKAGYAETFLEYDRNSRNPFYDMMIVMMEAYDTMDSDSQNVIQNYFRHLQEIIKKKDGN